MAIRHPSKSKLTRWLDSGETGKIGEHVEHCERCADQLLMIDSDESADTNHPDRRARRARLAEMLSAMYSAPDDLNDRVVEGVERRSKGERELALFAGLMAVGLETARLVTTGSTPVAEHGDVSQTRYGRDEDSDVASGESASQARENREGQL